MIYPPPSKRAFSLVELSIVLVILGLLVGGVLAGQSLIRAAELRKVSTEMANYSSAVLSFRDKYFALPGDIPNALNFWPGASPDCPFQSWNTNTALTCNGNGDGIINALDSASPPTEDFVAEMEWAWGHLAKAGLIEGAYDTSRRAKGTSKAGSPSSWRLLGTRADFGWNNKYYGTNKAAEYGNHLEFTGINTNKSATIQGVLSPEEAWSIDTKMDDGKPGTGKVRAPGQHYHSNGAMGCTTTANASTSAYNLTEIDYYTPGGYTLPPVSQWCELMFVNNF